jgi:hypothetical protein
VVTSCDRPGEANSRDQQDDPTTCEQQEIESSDRQAASTWLGVVRGSTLVGLIDVTTHLSAFTSIGINTR